MSAKLLGVAFEARMENQARKLVLLKLVDCADDDGRHIFPSNETIARQAEVAVRTVQRVTKEFVTNGLLRLIKSEDKSTRLRTNEYALNLDLLYQLSKQGWSSVFAAENDADDTDAKGDRELPSDSPTDDTSNALSGTPWVTLTPFKGDKLCHPTPYEPSNTPYPESNIEDPGANSEDGGDADYTFERFQADYPRPDDGQWRVWGDVQRNIWPFLDLNDRKQAIECLPTYRRDIRTGKSRLCTPKTFLKEARFVDLHAEAVRPKHNDLVHVRKEVPYFYLILKWWIEAAPEGQRRTGKSAELAGGLSVPKGWIPAAIREHKKNPPPEPEPEEKARNFVLATDPRYPFLEKMRSHGGMTDDGKERLLHKGGWYFTDSQVAKAERQMAACKSGEKPACQANQPDPVDQDDGFDPFWSGASPPNEPNPP